LVIDKMSISYDVYTYMMMMTIHEINIFPVLF